MNTRRPLLRSLNLTPLCLALAFGANGCSDDGGGNGGVGGGGDTPVNQGGSTSINSGTGTAGVQGGSTSTPTATSATGGALPNGGLEYKGIVNLVDAQGATDLDTYIGSMGRYIGTSTQTLDRLVKLFYEQYEDEYDFVIFLTDHNVATGPQGVFHAVNRPPMIGTGVVPRGAPSGIAPPNLKGTIAVELENLEDMPPFAHEILHFWANDLDPSFGFGRDLVTNYGSHWGITSVNGQLGGFDANTLRCETPAGQVPPNCTPEADGRYRYIVDWFAPNTYITPDKTYAPLELYLMGLIPASAVTEPIQVVNDVTYDVDNPVYPASGSGVVLTASGISKVSISDIIAFHGERKLSTETERNVRVAFVLVSATKASQTYLEQVANLAAVFGGEQTSAKLGWKSYNYFTSGKGTLTWKIGTRRDTTVALEPWVSPIFQECSTLMQNCPGNLTCYGTSNLYCAHTGSLNMGEACKDANDCNKGLTCSWIPGSVNDYVCSPYCDSGNTNASSSCATLCPTGNGSITAADGKTVVGAYCFGGAGGVCNPLTQDCPTGSACVGSSTTACRVPGTIAQGQTCTYSADCVKGSTCVGVTGSTTYSCQPYCDPSVTATPTIACSNLCPDDYWTLDNGAGLCIPGN